MKIDKKKVNEETRRLLEETVVVCNIDEQIQKNQLIKLIQNALQRVAYNEYLRGKKIALDLKVKLAKRR